jgi:hypothetical protein
MEPYRPLEPLGGPPPDGTPLAVLLPIRDLLGTDGVPDTGKPIPCVVKLTVAGKNFPRLGRPFVIGVVEVVLNNSVIAGVRMDPS